MGAHRFETTEQKASKISLEGVDKGAFATVSSMAAERDTVGWLRFLQDDVSTSERYVRAAWQLNEHAAVADHLAQILEKQGKNDDAIHLRRLALALDRGYEAAREHLQKASVSVADALDINAAAELVQLQTIAINPPGMSKQTSQAGFYLLITRSGVEDARVIYGEKL